jgi:hypothetical protein
MKGNVTPAGRRLVLSILLGFLTGGCASVQKLEVVEEHPAHLSRNDE